MRVLILTVSVLLLSFCPASAELKPGDLVFKTSTSKLSMAIQLASHSRYSHMGIVLFKEGQPVVFHAGPTMRYDPYEAWIASGVDGHYVVKRLKTHPDGLSKSELEKIMGNVRGFEGDPYDHFFEWSDERIYCSELVWKLYDRALKIQIGEQKQLKDFDLSHAEVKAKLSEYYGENIPFEEPIISPAAMFDSELLYTVESRPVATAPAGIPALASPLSH